MQNRWSPRPLIMKYFTKDLWLSYSESNIQSAIKQGERSLQEYATQLEQLRPRLSKRAFRFFKEENLHDGRLTALVAGDDPDHEIHGKRLFDINARRTSVYLKVLGQDLDVLYTLRYTKVRRILFDFPSAEPLYYEEGDQIGDWGYDEITAADDSYLRHEVLFASGATILVEFKHFNYKKERCEGSRYQSQFYLAS